MKKIMICTGFVFAFLFVGTADAVITRNVTYSAKFGLKTTPRTQWVIPASSPFVAKYHPLYQKTDYVRWRNITRNPGHNLSAEEEATILNQESGTGITRDTRAFETEGQVKVPKREKTLCGRTYMYNDKIESRCCTCMTSVPPSFWSCVYSDVYTGAGKCAAVDLGVVSVSATEEGTVNLDGDKKISFGGIIKNIGGRDSAGFLIQIFIDKNFKGSVEVGSLAQNQTYTFTEGNISDLALNPIYLSPGEHAIQAVVQYQEDKDSKNNQLETKFTVSGVVKP